MIVGTVFDGSPSICLAATTAITVTSDPTDRSNSPDASTKYAPMARIASGADVFR